MTQAGRWRLYYLRLLLPLSFVKPLFASLVHLCLYSRRLLLLSLCIYTSSRQYPVMKHEIKIFLRVVQTVHNNNELSLMQDFDTSQQLHIMPLHYAWVLRWRVCHGNNSPLCRHPVRLWTMSPTNSICSIVQAIQAILFWSSKYGSDGQKEPKVNCWGGKETEYWKSESAWLTIKEEEELVGGRTGSTGTVKHQIGCWVPNNVIWDCANNAAIYQKF